MARLRLDASDHQGEGHSSTAGSALCVDVRMNVWHVQSDILRVNCDNLCRLVLSLPRAWEGQGCKMSD